MKIFLITMFVLYIIRFFYFAVKLSEGNYPRMREEYADVDVARLIVAVGMGGWAAALIFF